jgi:hypothetical protein
MTANTVTPQSPVTNFPEGSFTPVPYLIPFSLGAPPPPHVPLRKDEIVRRLRTMLATNALSAPDGEAVLAAIYKLEMQP